MEDTLKFRKQNGETFAEIKNTEDGLCQFIVDLLKDNFDLTAEETDKQIVEARHCLRDLVV